MGKFKNNAERIRYLNQKEEEIADRQENNLVLDFDQAIKDENIKKIEIKLLGKTYFLPHKMPFNFSTFFLRNCYKKVKGEWTIIMEDDKVPVFLRLMFGDYFIKNIENSGDNRISLEFVMAKIVPQVMKAWGYDMEGSPERIKDTQKKNQTLDS